MDNHTEEITLEVKRNSTKNQELVDAGSYNLLTDNWILGVLFSAAILAFVAVALIKRHQENKARQKREEQYLAHFHEVLPQSLLYGNMDNTTKSKPKPETHLVNVFSSSGLHSIGNNLETILENIETHQSNNSEGQISAAQARQILMLQLKSDSYTCDDNIHARQNSDDSKADCYSIDDNDLSSGVSDTTVVTCDIHSEPDTRTEAAHEITHADISIEITMADEIGETTRKDRSSEVTITEDNKISAMADHISEITKTDTTPPENQPIPQHDSEKDLTMSCHTKEAQEPHIVWI